MKTLLICSGGLDSVTLAYTLAADKRLAGIVSFDYGQRHRTELSCAETCARDLNAPFSLIDISGIGAHLSGSALTDSIEIPEGHYREESMKITVVPNRNAIMLSIAYGIAAARSLAAVAAAFHGGDHYIYPDCRPGFAQSFEAMQKQAMDGIADIKLLTPFIHIAKSDIVRQGARQNVPFEKTWSCYKGGLLHCGRCGTCVERREAFHLAGVTDPTLYGDADFWIAAIEKKRA